jgi:UDP-glucose:(heptosyl)LPS alpha-1,3-glucosyltransferase
MRIALLRRRFSPTGGAERYLERLAAALRDSGHKVTLICESWPAPDTALDDVRTVPSNNPTSFALTIAGLSLHKEFDVVFSLERVPGCDVYRAGDGVHAEWLEQRADYGGIKGRIQNWLRPKNREICALETEVFRPGNTRHIIANSEQIKKSIIARFAYPSEQISVIYNGIPVKKYASGNRANGRAALDLSPNQYVVLLVGAGRERKGVKYARAAVKKVPGARLVVIDRPPPAPMPDVYAAADVFILPTLYDPFANVTLEALAAGLPVLTTRHNGACEIITPGKNGIVFERADAVNDMARALVRLSHPQEREAFRAPALELAHQFDIHRNVEETVRCLTNLTR